MEEKAAKKTAVLCCIGTGVLPKQQTKQSGQSRKLPPAAREVHKQ